MSYFRIPGSVASPGPKPVNFDFHRPDARANPNLVHPVALRLSPESPVIPTSDDEDDNNPGGAAAGGGLKNGSGVGAAAAPLNVKQGRREVVYEQLWNQVSPMFLRLLGISLVSNVADLRPPPPPPLLLGRRHLAY